jgi:hypothetical protein
MTPIVDVSRCTRSEDCVVLVLSPPQSIHDVIDQYEIRSVAIAVWLLYGVLTSLSIVVQLYRGCQFYWWRKPPTCRKSLTNFIT